MGSKSPNNWMVITWIENQHKNVIYTICEQYYQQFPNTKDIMTQVNFKKIFWNGFFGCLVQL